MTQSNTKQSLKANKAKAHAPSKAEVILSDSVKLSLAPVTGEASKAFELYAKQQDASVAYDTAHEALVNDLYGYLAKAAPDYANYQAIKKHLITSIASVKGRAEGTIENWLNKRIIPAVKALGYELPKAESSAAQGMASLRASLAAIADHELQGLIEQSAKAGDFKKASQLATEKQKREKAHAREVSKAESANTKALRDSLRDWVKGADHELLAAMLWAKNHNAQFLKVANIK